MDAFRKLRWAIQRVFRGWDDRVIWSIDMYLARMMPVWLRQLKSQKHGVPPLVFHGDDVDLEESEKLWEEILDEMIEGFEAARRIHELDLPALDELRQEELRRFGKTLIAWDDENTQKLGKLYADLDFWKKLEEQEEEEMIKFRQGMTLLTEHFFSLWD